MGNNNKNDEYMALEFDQRLKEIMRDINSTVNSDLSSYKKNLGMVRVSFFLLISISLEWTSMTFVLKNRWFVQIKSRNLLVKYSKDFTKVLWILLEH
jgi:hypothetical protein